MTYDQQEITLTLQVDWGIGPFWVAMGNSIPDDYLPEEISDIVSLSEELISAVSRWDEWFQNTFNSDFPQESGILDELEKKKFDKEGRELARRIKQEASTHIVVEYVSLEGATEIME